MEIGAAEYRAAAEEHLQAAFFCYQKGGHLACHYLCGLAVECILRAYRWQIDTSFDGRHVLPQLYLAADFDRIVPQPLVKSTALAFDTIFERWSYTHRYASPAKLLKHLNGIRATSNVKGDKLKNNSARMYEATELIVGLGNEKWKG